MTSLWLGIVVGSSEAPPPHAQPTGSQVCFFGCKGSDGTCSHEHDMWSATGSMRSICSVPSGSVPTALCNVVLVVHRVGGLVLDVAPV